MKDLTVMPLSVLIIIGVMFLTLFALCNDCNSKSIDRSGFEIFSIITSEIKKFQFKDDNFEFEATRIAKSSNKFKLKILNRSTGFVKNCTYFGNKIDKILTRFSTFRNVKKINIEPNHSAQVLGVIIIEDYSILDPAEFSFLIKNDLIFLERDKDEFYTVDISMSEFKKLKKFCSEQIASQK